LNKFPPAGGFSLLEVMIACAILLVVLTASAGTLSMSSRFIAERKLRTTAEMVAQSHMELLLATASRRPIVSSDCQTVRYTRAVLGDEELTAVFAASCTIDKNTPATPEQKIDRLTVTIDAELDLRRLRTQFVTYLVAPEAP
jgi:prepilin-type N-terminal cleavage/methylation domain-containing protein